MAAAKAFAGFLMSPVTTATEPAANVGPAGAATASSAPKAKPGVSNATPQVPNLASPADADVKLSTVDGKLEGGEVKLAIANDKLATADPKLAASSASVEGADQKSAAQDEKKEADEGASAGPLAALIDVAKASSGALAALRTRLQEESEPAVRRRIIEAPGVQKDPQAAAERTAWSKKSFSPFCALPTFTSLPSGFVARAKAFCFSSGTKKGIAQLADRAGAREASSCSSSDMSIGLSNWPAAARAQALRRPPAGAA